MLSFYVNYPKGFSPYVIKGVEFLRWYSLMYIVAFAITFVLFRIQLKRNETRIRMNWRSGEDLDMLIWIMLAAIAGGRLGSCLLYSGSYYWTHPHLIFWPFSGGEFVGLPGMSYHGGVIGVCIAMWIFSKKRKTSFFDISDPILISLPFGYFFGRMGNFFNAELYGKVSSSAFGMVFPDANRFSTSLPWVREVCDKIGMDLTSAAVNLPRHPSQLYEALFEGIVLGAIMWLAVRPAALKLKRGVPSGLYLVAYGFFRFIIEYFRQPDENMGYIIRLGKGSDNIYVFSSLFNLSMGQILCFLMIAAGAVIVWMCGRRADVQDALPAEPVRKPMHIPSGKSKKAKKKAK